MEPNPHCDFYAALSVLHKYDNLMKPSTLMRKSLGILLSPCSPYLLSLMAKQQSFASYSNTQLNDEILQLKKRSLVKYNKSTSSVNILPEFTSTYLIIEVFME